MRIVKIALIILCIVFLTSCSSDTVYAPVVAVSTIDPLPKSGVYKVRSNDTLYSIAWRYGLDYRYLAKINHFPSSHYAIKQGQLIYLKRSAVSSQIVKPFSSRKIEQRQIETVRDENTPNVIIEKEPTRPVYFWRWPAYGPVIANFSAMNKGINISGHVGDSVFAAAAGKIVYSGDGLRDYGNLIIIKHNSVFFSAYAYNSLMLVKEGEWVSSGQKIAQMGYTRDQRVMLHFEIRQNGKPVNPLSYLSRK